MFFRYTFQFHCRASELIGRDFISRELGNYFLHDNGCIWGTSIRCNIENKETEKATGFRNHIQIYIIKFCLKHSYE